MKSEVKHGRLENKIAAQDFIFDAQELFEPVAETLRVKKLEIK